jgi:hypothetical protein
MFQRNDTSVESKSKINTRWTTKIMFKKEKKNYVTEAIKNYSPKNSLKALHTGNSDLDY